MFKWLVCVVVVSAVLARQEQQECLCKNGGSCVQPNRRNKCRCLPEYVGLLCQARSRSISNASIWENVDENYTFFSFEPPQPNFYKFTFQICMKQNVRELENLIFMEVRQQHQQIHQEPSYFSTAKISIKQGTCLSFSTDFIEIKTVNNISLMKVIFGIKTCKNTLANYFYRSLTGRNRRDLVTEYRSQQNAAVKDKYQQRLSFSVNIQIYEQTPTEKALKNCIKCLLFISVNTIIYIFTKIMLYSYSIEPSDILRSFLLLIRMVCRKFVSSSDTKSYMEYLNIRMHEQLCATDQLHKDQCAICLQSFAQHQIIRQTSCNHIYHQSCLDRWSFKHGTCPLCRQQLHSKHKGWLFNFLQG